jgi:hypothetical protein
MPRSAALAIAALVLITAVAPPGLCPCWLLRDASVHPHLIDPGPGDHPHEYIFELFSAMGDAAVPGISIPVTVLLAALAAAALWQETEGTSPAMASWTPLPLLPPPRFSA